MDKLIVGIGIVAALAVLWFISTSAQTRWGFSGDGVPRLEFRSEVECWRYLDTIKKVNPKLVGAACTARNVPWNHQGSVAVN